MTDKIKTAASREQAGWRAAALQAIERLLAFASARGLIEEADSDYSRNLLLARFGFDEPFAGEMEAVELDSLQPVLDVLLDYGYETGLIAENTDTYRDLLDAQIMGMLMARPSEVARTFCEKVAAGGIEAATDWFYRLSIDSNYIRMDRVIKNVYWKQLTPYGELEITINLSKPEKSIEEIARAKLLPPPAYPKCLLCRENVGYAGRLNHPARQNLRIIPLEMNGEPWFFQYSPYVYYNEHCIVFHHDHVPMKLTRDTFKRLLSFTESFPHYFIGSNADLPIVGGSILTHDHFQGGRHTFAIQQAAAEQIFKHSAYPAVQVAIVKWPLSVVRLTSVDAGQLLAAVDALYEAWQQYSDPSVDVLAFSDSAGEQVPHNTVTPIVRRGLNGNYEMDIVLRNNRTNEQHPEGIFHPHSEMHHLKKENIGLIEVMGLAILPGRLKEELDAIADMLSGDAGYAEVVRQGDHPLHKHVAWIDELIGKYGQHMDKEEAARLLQHEVGLKFSTILEHAGVFKRGEEGQKAFQRFLVSLGYLSMP